MARLRNYSEYRRAQFNQATAHKPRSPPASFEADSFSAQARGRRYRDAPQGILFDENCSRNLGAGDRGRRSANSPGAFLLQSAHVALEGFPRKSRSIGKFARARSPPLETIAERTARGPRHRRCSSGPAISSVPRGDHPPAARSSAWPGSTIVVDFLLGGIGEGRQRESHGPSAVGVEDFDGLAVARL